MLASINKLLHFLSMLQKREVSFSGDPGGVYADIVGVCVGFMNGWNYAKINIVRVFLYV